MVQRIANTKIGDLYYEQMKNGTFNEESSVAGYNNKGILTLSDGNHKMNAAIKFLLLTGNGKCFDLLINNGYINRSVNY